jgi:transposase
MSPVRVNLRLHSLDAFFRTPDIDPFSDWYEPYSDRPAIEYVQACVADAPGAGHVELVVALPASAVRPDTADRLRAAIAKYCDAHLVTVDRDSRRNNARGWLMLAFTIVVVNFFVWLSIRLSENSHEMFSVAAEGLSIAAWVLLWHPLEALVFNRWDYRLDRRVWRTIRDGTTVRVEALPDKGP